MESWLINIFPNKIIEYTSTKSITAFYELFKYTLIHAYTPHQCTRVQMKMYCDQQCTLEVAFNCALLSSFIHSLTKSARYILTLTNKIHLKEQINHHFRISVLYILCIIFILHTCKILFQILTDSKLKQNKQF